MNEKDENPNVVTNASSTGGLSPATSYLEECLCGCGQATDGQTLAYVDDHADVLVNSIIADEYGGIAEFVTTHSAGLAGNAHWRLTPWQPTTAIGQQARGRVFAVPHLQSFEFVVHEPSAFAYIYEDEVLDLCKKIFEAGARLDVVLGDPFARIRSGYIDRQESEEALQGRPAHTQDDPYWNLLRVKERMAAAAAEPADRQYALQEKILREATAENVYDVSAWASLACLAWSAGRAADTLSFSEAAVAVSERFLPCHFSGTLRKKHALNKEYQRGRMYLMLSLWELQRFADAYRVAVDSVWLDPTAGEFAMWIWYLKREFTREEALAWSRGE